MSFQDYYRRTSALKTFFDDWLQIFKSDIKHLIILYEYLTVPGVPKQVKRLFDHRTKGFSSIIKFFFDFNEKHSNLDIETKFTQIRHELIGKHQFQNFH